jgi:elongation factor Ts
MNIQKDAILLLRKQTGAGLMACREALSTANGNIKEAISVLQQAEKAHAAEKSHRIAKEGLIITLTSDDAKKGVLLEVNCETDFVSRSQPFQEFAQQLAQIALQHSVETPEALLQLPFTPHTTVEQALQALVGKIRENIQIQRLKWIATPHQLGAYSHNGQRACLVELEGGDIILANDIALHIVGYNPLFIAPEAIPQTVLDEERKAVTARLQTSNQSIEAIQALGEAHIKKFINESSLLTQAFIKNQNLTVAQALQAAKAKIISFTHFILNKEIH